MTLCSRDDFFLRVRLALLVDFEILGRDAYLSLDLAVIFVFGKEVILASECDILGREAYLPLDLADVIVLGKEANFYLPHCFSHQQTSREIFS